jgi:hypothetical protein
LCIQTKDYSISVGKIYTNIEGLWNRLVPRSEKKEAYMANEIVGMEALDLFLWTSLQ